MKRWMSCWVVVGLALNLLSCQRSAQLRKDGDSASSWNDSHSYSYKPSSPSLAQKVEAIGQPKKRIIILNFWNDTPVNQSDLGVYTADELRRGLDLSQRVILMNDHNDFNTEDFVDGSHVRVSQLIREGRRLGVAVLAIGRVTKVAFRQRGGDDVGLFRQRQSLAAVDVEMKLFDVQGGREIMASVQSGEASANALAVFEGSNLDSPTYRTELTRYALREAVAKFVPDVVRSIDKLAWQGRIAKRQGPKIYINAGRASGLISGDILRVMNPGEEVYDPQTGALLGRAQGQLKGTLEVVDFMGADGAVAEVHTGGSFKEGDLVQLY